MHQLPKNYILKGYKSFSRVLTLGKKQASGSIRCFYLPVEREKRPPRVGFATIRSIRKASERNRVKRLMREAYRLNRDSLFSVGEYPISDLVLLYAGAGKKRAHYSVVERDVILLLKKLMEKG